VLSKSFHDKEVKMPKEDESRWAISGRRVAWALMQPCLISAASALPK